MEAGVGREPGASDVHLGVGVEVHVTVRIGNTDVWQMASHIARREVEGAIQCDGEVGEITADPIAALQDVPRRQIGAGRTCIGTRCCRAASD